eukprot:GHVS01107852.1.p1 GENE.GHVS01107852.1~~GHVS01107852.1.p1  ORF type:complete len:162 (+),score=46.95 GHVS01107852.1:225-710(+)
MPTTASVPMTTKTTNTTTTTTTGTTKTNNNNTSSESSTPTTTTTSRDMTVAQLQQSLNRLDKEKLSYYAKIQEMHSERAEYRLVLNACEEVPPDRRCFRMVGGVLVERTAGEVKPVISKHKLRMEEAITKLTEEFEKITQERNFVAERIRNAVEVNSSNVS